MSSPNTHSVHSLFRLALLAVFCLGASAALEAQEQTQTVDKDTLQALLKRVDQLEARLQRFADRFHARLSRELETK